MSYLDMRTDFETLLDRDDCTDALADTFLRQGIGRIQRQCRLPSMERSLLITPASPMVQFPVPTDLIQIIDVIVPIAGSSTGQMRPLKRTAFRRLVEYDNTDVPRVYARWQTQVYIAGAVPIGQQLEFLYYGNFSAFASVNADNELSASTPDLAIYAALTYAGDYFTHPKTQMWKDTYGEMRDEVIAMAVDLENEGGVAQVEPVTGMCFEDD